MKRLNNLQINTKKIDKSLWDGEICIGALHVPVSLYPAVQERDHYFRLLHKKDEQPIRYKKFCQSEDIEVNSSDIVKGFEFRQNEFITLSEDELTSLNTDSPHRLTIDKFIPLYSINPVYYHKSYFLGPRSEETLYRLLLLALWKMGKAGLGRLSWRKRIYPVLLSPYYNVFTVTTLHYADEVLSTEKLGETLAFQSSDEPEFEPVLDLIENMTGKPDLSEYKDSYRERLEQLVSEKVKKHYPAESERVEFVLQKIEEHHPAESTKDEREDLRSLVKNLQKSLEHIEKKI